MKFGIKSKGTPKYTVWAFNSDTNKWDCWGLVHSTKDYPDMLERINRGDFHHSQYKGHNNYTKICYLRDDDENGNPNRMGIV